MSSTQPNKRVSLFLNHFPIFEAMNPLVMVGDNGLYISKTRVVNTWLSNEMNTWQLLNTWLSDEMKRSTCLYGNHHLAKNIVIICKKSYSCLLYYYVGLESRDCALNLIASFGGQRG